MTLSFTKMNGAGNDFVMLDNRAAELPLTTAQIVRLCDRHRGIGADGVLAVEPAQNGADFRMRYYNADGGEAEMCGNGARCFARYARRISGHTGDTISFETQAGVIAARCEGELVQIDMSTPHSYAPAASLELSESSGEAWQVSFINTGVPHAVIFVDDLESAAVTRIGSGIRYHGHFAPRGTNVNFVQVAAPGKIAIRTYERGVEDETLACGTGVVASALIHHLTSGATAPVDVRVRGGETLRVGFEPAEVPGAFRSVTLTGPADFVFDGTVAL